MQEINTLVVYRFKVSLFYDKRTYRQIDILGSQTLETFHEIIFNAFDRYDEHLYSFFLTRKNQKSTRKISESDEYSLPSSFDDNPFFRKKKKQNVKKTKIAFLHLNVKDKMYYLFDYGDEWWHEITLLLTYNSITSSNFPKVVKKVGDSPSQYPEDDEDFEE